MRSGVRRVAKVGKVAKAFLDPDHRGIGGVGKVAPPYKGATFPTLTHDRGDQPVCTDLIETEIPGPRLALDHSLRLLARWLIAAARRGAPVVGSRPAEDSQNRLDVGRGAKVGSDG